LTGRLSRLLLACGLHKEELEVVMNTMVPYVVTWCLLALVVLGLALFRKFTSLREDSLIHIGPGEEKLIPKQVATFRTLEVLDRWGQIQQSWSRSVAYFLRRCISSCAVINAIQLRN
jgi:hypothetical protein